MSLHSQVAEENGYRIRYIGLNIEDDALSEPGSFEALEVGNPDEHTHRRDRHVRLKCEPLLSPIAREMRSLLACGHFEMPCTTDSCSWE